MNDDIAHCLADVQCHAECSHNIRDCSLPEEVASLEKTHATRLPPVKKINGNKTH